MTAPARMVEASDADIIGESRHQPERFAAIFDRHFSEVHRYVERRLGGDIADDIASDTFLTAFGKRDSYDTSRPDARPWLYGIATNLVGKHRRRQTSALRAYRLAATTDTLGGHEDQVAARVSAQRRRGELVHALARLSPGEQDVLFLVALAEFTHQEVAEALGISYGTVGSRLSRARAKLSRHLGQPTSPGTEKD